MLYGTGRRAGAVRVIIGAAVGAAFLVASAAPATAHTALKASSPKDRGKIDKAPSRIVLEYTEPIKTIGARVVVRGPDGQAYQAGTSLIAGNKLTQPLKPLGRAGEYVLEFRIVAADGHPLTGGIRFTLTKPGPAAGGARAVAPPATLAPVSTLNTVYRAPSWAPWIGSAVVVMLAFGAVLFGRRMTRGLD